MKTIETTMLISLISKCRAAEVPKVYASTQYGMGFLVADSGPNSGGIVFRDDAMPHAERVELADQLNAVLENPNTCGRSRAEAPCARRQASGR